MSTSVLVRYEEDEGDFSHWSRHEWPRGIISPLASPTDEESVPDFSHWSIHQWPKAITLPTENESIPDFSQSSRHQWPTVITLPTEDESVPDFSHWSIRDWLRARTLSTDSAESMQMDVGLDDHEKGEEYGVSGAVTKTSSMSFDDAVSVNTTPCSMLVYKSIEQEQFVRKADFRNTSMDTEERPSGSLHSSVFQFHADYDDREASISGDGLLRQESLLRAFPPPPRPPPALRPLPPEWKEIFDPATGQNYYYNVKSEESTWERPRLGEKLILDEDAAEQENSSIGIGNGEPSYEPSSSAFSLPDENADMKAIVAIEEKDGEQSTPNSTTNDSAKIQRSEIDDYSVTKSRWRPFKTGGDQKVKKILTTLFKPGIRLDQTAFDVFSGRTPRSSGYYSSPTSTSPVREEKKVMDFFKRLPIFELLEEHVLSAVCSRLSLDQYSETSEVFRQKEPIEHMLFIVRGNLECRGENGSVSRLKEGDFCGEEALFRCTDTAGAITLNKSHPGEHQLSRRTVVCMTPVEAYCLDAEAIEYITTEYKASFASSLVQGTIRYFSQYGWSLAATTTQKTRTSKKEKIGGAPSTDASSKLDDSTQNKEDHDDKVSDLQNVPTSEDVTDALNSSAPLPDADEMPKMDAPIEEDTLKATPAPSRSNSAKMQTEDGNQTGKKTWWQPFKSDGDQSGNKLIKWTEKIGKIRKNGDNRGTKSPFYNAASLTSPLLGEDEVEEDVTIPLPVSLTSDLGSTPGEGENPIGKKKWWKNLAFQGKKVESTDKNDNTEEHGVHLNSPEATALSEELSGIPKLLSPSPDETVLIEPYVRPEEQDTTSSIPIPSTSNFDDRIDQEIDSHSGKKIRPQPVKPGGYQEWKKTSWGIFKNPGDRSVSHVDMLKKVPIFDLLEGHILEAICEHLSWKRYTKSSEVLLKDKPVMHLLFIIRGKLEYLGEDESPLHLKEGDYCGEELLDWCTDRVGVSTLKKMDPHGSFPSSSRTVTCLTTVQAFSLDFQALTNITTQFKFAFRSPFVQGAVRYVSVVWRSLAATRIQQAWRSSKGIIGPSQGHPNNETELVQDTERENSSSGTQEAPCNTEPIEVCEGESIWTNGDGVSFPPTRPPSEFLSDTATSVPTRPPSEVLSDTATSVPIRPPSEVLSDTAASVPTRPPSEILTGTAKSGNDEMKERNQEEADASNCKLGPSPPDYGETEQEGDDHHSAKRFWWRPFRAGQSEKKRPQPFKATEDLTIPLDGMARKFTYRQLKAATGGFAEDSKLGQGGFGSVYAGVLPSSGLQVAVKKMDGYAQKQGVKEFMAEVSIINRLRHRNLIQLLGWCDDAAKKKYLLVYELMPHGSLEQALFRRDEKETTSLSWPQRLYILTGTAAGLEYLHQGWNQQVIHRDVKLSNILLSQDWTPKIADLGLARLVEHHRLAATTNVAGTMGYLAPEVIAEGRFTEKADVFGFGVVALEVACGRKVHAAYPDKMGLVDFVWHAVSEGDLLSAVDRRLHNEYEEYWVQVVLMVGLLCTHPDPHARPAMRRVVQILTGDVPVPSIPASKPTPVFCSVPQISISDLDNRKAGGHSKSASTSQVSTTSASATSSTSNSSIGITRSSN